MGLFGRVFWNADRKVAAFGEGGSEQSDDEFLAACGLPPDLEAARAALAVPRAVAAIGSVDTEFIRAEDAYPDQLGVLPLWDSIDWFAFTWELEERLGQRLPDPAKHPIAIHVSVKQMAADVYRLSNKQTAAQPGAARSKTGRTKRSPARAAARARCRAKP
jgi:hypothetical protein